MQQDIESTETQVRGYFDAVEGASSHVKIVSDMGDSVLEYECDYEYNKNDSDKLTITAPELLQGITISIAGENKSEFLLQYEQTELDTAGIAQPGLTPADVVPYLLYELGASSPTAIWEEKADGMALTVIQYTEPETDCGEVIRQIWINPDTHMPVVAEVYVEGTRRLQCFFGSWMGK